MAIGQINLALLVAVLSVLVTLFSVAAPLLRSKRAHILTLFEMTVGKTASFLVRNEGRTSGSIVMQNFAVTVRSRPEWVYVAEFQPEGKLIGADKEEQITVTVDKDVLSELYDFLEKSGFLSEYNPQVPYDQAYQRYFSMTSALQCTFFVSVADFEGFNYILTEAPCANISWVGDSLKRWEVTSTGANSE